MVQTFSNVIAYGKKDCWLKLLIYMTIVMLYMLDVACRAIIMTETPAP